MLKITFTKQAQSYLKKREMLDKVLLLIVDDGGGKYSLRGGNCSFGSHFSLIWVKQKDKDYPLQLNNEQGIKVFTSKYDLALMGPNLVVDYQAGALSLNSDEGLLDGGMDIGNGPALLKANENVELRSDQKYC